MTANFALRELTKMECHRMIVYGAGNGNVDIERRL